MKDLKEKYASLVFKELNRYSNGSAVKSLEIINKLFKELEELNNRSCESCKYFEEINDRCNRGVFLNWKHEIDDDSFYCSRFEPKDKNE